MVAVLAMVESLATTRISPTFADKHMQQFLKTRRWPTTDAVKAFDAACASLTASGIVVIHNGPCCDTCVGAYLWGEVVPAENASLRQPRGYIFYNEQSSETVRNGGDLWLACGPIPESNEAEEENSRSIAISQWIIDSLSEFGLTAHADDSPNVVRVFVDVGVERSSECIQTGRIADLDKNGVCPQCSGTGDCYCIRRGTGNADGCVRCGGSSKCRSCDGIGKNKLRRTMR